MTGPFYIEGADPGDTLVVHFDKLYPNRDWGWDELGNRAQCAGPGFYNWD